MSNQIIDKPAVSAPQPTTNAAPSLPSTAPVAAASVATATAPTPKLHQDDLVKLAQLVAAQTKQGAKVVEKKQVKITDYSTLTQDDIYNLDIAIEAKPVMAPDILKADLVDKNYEGRWVNKDPRRLGDAIAKGFTYVERADLRELLHLDTAEDAEGHFTYGDVVLMKIPKSQYYAWLRATHERTIASTRAMGAQQQGKAVAQQFMREGNATGFADAQAKGYIEFFGSSTNS